MRPRRSPFVQVTGVAFALLALAACAPAKAPGWTIGPGASGSPSVVEASASPTAVPLPTEAASPTNQPSSPSPTDQPTGSPGPEATPRPPDPGEPGFVAGTQAHPRVIDIETNDLLLFDPTVVTVAQGETIKFRITNVGLAEHEFKVGPMQDVFSDLESAPEIPSIPAGATKTLTYTFSGTGPYAYGCHEPGHYENGMIGFVNVVPTSPWRGTVAHPRMIVIRMDDHLEFVPSEVTVAPNETILFVLPNVGSDVTHEFQIGPADRVALDQVDGQIVLEADQIEPHHVAYMTYTFGVVGPYAYACHEPGHYESGMKGVIDLSP
jgi:uncharacterized cupredoxin-like copper-binding protein